jgi:hypothetical protein
VREGRSVPGRGGVGVLDLYANAVRARAGDAQSDLSAGWRLRVTDRVGDQFADHEHDFLGGVRRDGLRLKRFAGDVTCLGHAARVAWQQDVHGGRVGGISQGHGETSQADLESISRDVGLH